MRAATPLLGRAAPVIAEHCPKTVTDAEAVLRWGENTSDAFLYPTVPMQVPDGASQPVLAQTNLAIRTAGWPRQCKTLPRPLMGALSTTSTNCHIDVYDHYFKNGVPSLYFACGAELGDRMPETDLILGEVATQDELASRGVRCARLRVHIPG